MINTPENFYNGPYTSKFIAMLKDFSTFFDVYNELDSEKDREELLKDFMRVLINAGVL